MTNEAINKVSITVILIICLLSCNNLDLEKVDFLTIETGMVINKTTSSVSLQGEISGLENGKIQEYGYIYSCAQNVPLINQLETEKSSLGITNENGTFTNTIQNLNFNTTYYIRAYAFFEDELNPVYGEVIQVLLGKNDLVVTTDSVILDTKSFEIFGNLKGLQTDVSISNHGFAWSNENEIPSIENDQAIYLGSLNGNQSFQIELNDVEQLKYYHMRAFVQLGKDVFYGETKSFFKGDLWIQKESAPKPLASDLFSSVGGKAYIYFKFFSEDNIFTYSPLSDTWLSTFTSADIKNNNGGCGFSVEEKLFITTGVDLINSIYNNELWEYDIITQSWEQVTESPFPGANRTRALTATIQGKAYVGMGLDSGGKNLNDLWVFDPTSASWNQIPSFPGDSRNKPIMFSTESELYIGLYTSFLIADKVLTDLWSYNVNTGTWSEKQRFPLEDLTAKSLTGFSIADNGYVVLSTSSNNFWQYNTTKDRWSPKADFPGIPRFGRANHFTINGKAYFGLGNYQNGEVASDLWEYIPDIDDL